MTFIHNICSSFNMLCIQRCYFFPQEMLWCHRASAGSHKKNNTLVNNDQLYMRMPQLVAHESRHTLSQLFILCIYGQRWNIYACVFSG